jgi:thiaminase (transcriptional activator TenA)
MLTYDPTYGSAVYGAWRAAAREPWQRYTRHAFVERIADGTLAHRSFVYYLVQDYVFLMHYARAWALAVVKAETREEMQLASSIVNGLTNHEIQLHVSVCAKEGICEDELFSADEAFENLAYTRYVMDTGLSGDFLDLMAVLTPCVFGYGEIGARIATERVAGTRYQPWIDTYADPQYQKLCDATAQLVESSSARRLGAHPEQSPRWPRLCARFAQATELEVGFWQMGLGATL